MSFDPERAMRVTPGGGRVYISCPHPHKSPNKSKKTSKAMAPRKFNFPGLPGDIQNLVISKLATQDAANLGMTSRDMRAVVAEPLKKIKQDREKLFRVLQEVLNRSFRDPAPQHETVGKYTTSTTRAVGPSPYYFHVTVASDELSMEFSVWDSDIRFQQPVSRPVISRSNMLTIGGKKMRFVPRFKKYDHIRKEVSDVTSCLKLAWVYKL